jgi:hypothetical protein
MIRIKLFPLSLILILAVGIFLTGCSRGWMQQDNSSSQLPSASSQAIQSVQEIQTFDATLSTGLDQLDSQLNDVQSTLTNTDTLDDFK